MLFTSIISYNLFLHRTFVQIYNELDYVNSCKNHSWWPHTHHHQKYFFQSTQSIYSQYSIITSTYNNLLIHDLIVPTWSQYDYKIIGQRVWLIGVLHSIIFRNAFKKEF